MDYAATCVDAAGGSAARLAPRVDTSPVVSGFSGRPHHCGRDICADTARRVLSPILFRPSSAPKALVTSTEWRLRADKKRSGPPAALVTPVLEGKPARRYLRQTGLEERLLAVDDELVLDRKIPLTSRARISANRRSISLPTNPISVVLPFLTMM